MPGGKDEKAQQPFDPFESMRGVRDAYLDTMSKAMIDAVNSEAYAAASGAMLDSYLTASAPFREALEKNMVEALQQLSLPSRQEVAALAERFTNVEMRLDDMDAKLDGIAKALAEEKEARSKAKAQPQADISADRPKQTAAGPARFKSGATPSSKSRPQAKAGRSQR
jgi:hypothetical protein